MAATQPGIRAYLRWFVPSAQLNLRISNDENLRLEQTREQLVTSLSRIISALGTIVLLFTIRPVLSIEAANLLPIYAIALAIIWTIALVRSWSHRVRAIILLSMVYFLGVLEIANFGFTEDGHTYLFVVAMLTPLVLDTRSGVIALLISFCTMLAFGLPISLGLFTPFTLQLKSLPIDRMLLTCLLFMVSAAVLQVGIRVLAQSLGDSWREEQQIRLQLEQERLLLEERVASRTRELTATRDIAINASNEWLSQSEYLETLHTTTLDLLNRRNLDDLLHTIVERATLILDAPYGELMLADGDELVVHAFTANQSFLKGDRVTRCDAQLCWQAFDTQQPAILDDYSAWSNRRVLYDGLQLRAVADFPIVVGSECLGILALGRSTPGYSFSAAQVQRGAMLARLVAVILDSVRQYELSVHEARERQRALAALEATAAELRAQNAELDAFAHTVAHDIKNPLASLIGFIQLMQLELQQHKLTPLQVDRQLGTILNLGLDLNTIIDELLMLASMRSNESITLQPLDMASIVGTLDSRLHALISSYGATIIRPDTWPLVFGHEIWITEVWTNYVSNAIKYGGRPALVELGADPPDQGMVRFWVRDNGAGLSAEQQHRLFTAFTRLHIDQAPGTGLGLSIVQRIIEKLGGQVGVESTPGVGSTFFFTLPSAGHEGAGISSVSRPPDLFVDAIAQTPAVAQPGRVLIVEDSPINQMIAQQMAIRLGYTVDIASNGREALEAIATQTYAYVLMDLQMPELDGVSATQRIRARGQEIVQPWIIALSATSLASEYERLREAGINGFLGKPITIHELREAFASNPLSNP